MEHIILIAAFFLIFFNTSGLATTNILRLTSGNKLPVLSSKCSCDNCGAPITPLLQLPIISYVACRGRCRNCRMKLPLDALFLEIAILTGMFVISATLSFSWVGITLSFIYYEIIRVVLVLKKGRRKDNFARQYVIAVLSMLPYYLITLFVSLIYRAVCN